MASKFFGQYLLERGKISRSALLDAVRFQRDVNRTLGQLALDRDLLTPDLVVEIHSEQRIRDSLFGEIAIEKGYLSEEQVRKLLGIQKNNYIYLGEALVERGHLSRQELTDLLIEFREVEPPTPSLPAQWAELHVNSSGEASAFVDQAQKLLLRVCDLRCKVGEVRRGGELGGLLPIASLKLVGDLDWCLLMTFGGDGSLATDFTTRFMGLVTESPEMSADACCEFLNIVAGSVSSRFRGLGTRIELRPPVSLSVMPASDLLLSVPLHCPEGEIVLGIDGIV